jgi:Na+-transporting methylmalonyl-CoA/oxaloacetate decarboxylase gamma subunit
MIFELILTAMQSAADTAKIADDVSSHLHFNLSQVGENGGFALTLIGYTVVFMALLFLIIFVSGISKVLEIKQRKKLRETGHRSAEREDLSIPGEINAAIAMALYLHFDEAHDIEDALMTIKKRKVSYTPWSQKIYNITEYPVIK